MFYGYVKRIIVGVDKGKIGTLRQAEAVAQILENILSPVEIIFLSISLPTWARVIPAKIFSLLPNFIKKTAFNLPDGDIFVASGHQAFNVALAYRDQIKTIVIMNPRVNPSYFDLLIVPYHDHVKGKNVFQIHGSVHNIDPKKVTAPEIVLNKDMNGHLALLLGGNSKVGKYNDQVATNLVRSLRRYLLKKREQGKKFDVLITPSRRTPKNWLEDFLRKLHFAKIPFWAWDGKGENPYPGMLNLCDEILVMVDSVSMITESCVFEKPVWVQNLKQNTTLRPKLARMIETLKQHNHVQDFADATKKEFTFYPLNQEDKIKHVLKEFCVNHGFI